MAQATPISTKAEKDVRISPIPQRFHSSTALGRLVSTVPEDFRSVTSVIVVTEPDTDPGSATSDATVG